jgi:hypothetical protein
MGRGQQIDEIMKNRWCLFNNRINSGKQLLCYISSLLCGKVSGIGQFSDIPDLVLYQVFTNKLLEKNVNHQ